jgi:hypothetical protein
MARDAHNPTRSPAPIKVSVIVPVYNPGRHINRLLTSLRRQSLPTDEFEVIFVDDGSTDGTAARLDALAKEVQNFTVIHTPHSGWPGKPRNIGVEAARGEYVHFVDNDDQLGAEALERLWNYASANDSDVVVGREVRRNLRRPAPELFRVNRPRATLDNDPLLAVLTPHKMFRRRFLAEHDIRFFEGPRRLEDHPFVVKAYFRANVVSVLSDYPCYYWVTRGDGGNAGRRPRNWAEWYGHMRDALDVVEAHTEPGPRRDRMLAHWYRTKGLGQLVATLGRGGADARAHFEALADLVSERFPATVDDHLPPIMRVRSHLLRAGEFEILCRLLGAERGMRPERRLKRLRAVDGELEFKVHAHLIYSDGSPVLVEHVAERAYWIPPVELGGAVPAEILDFTDGASRPALDVAVRRRSTHEVYALPGSTEPLAPEPDGQALLGATRTARLHPQTLQVGQPMALGTWGVRVQLGICGWHVHGPLPSAHSRLRDWRPDTVLGGPRAVVPRTNARGMVAVDVIAVKGPLARSRIPALSRRLRRATVDPAIRRVRSATRSLKRRVTNGFGVMGSGGAG